MFLSGGLSVVVVVGGSTGALHWRAFAKLGGVTAKRSLVNLAAFGS